MVESGAGVVPTRAKVQIPRLAPLARDDAGRPAQHHHLPSGSDSMRTRLTTLSLHGLCALVLAAGCSTQPAPQSAPTPAATAAADQPGRQWKPEDTEYYAPVPPIVTPGENGSP